MRVRLRVTITSEQNGEEYDRFIVGIDAPTTTQAVHWLRADIMHGLDIVAGDWDIERGKDKQ